MTIYDIAKMADVSASTVSRVINNKPGIKKETRDKILKLLEETGYIPNETARGLVTKSTRMIGVLVADIRNVHHTALAYVVEQHLRKNGYYMMLLNVGEEPEKMTESIQILEQRKVDGIIMIGSVFQNAEVGRKIKEMFNELPIIIANGFIDSPNVYGILVNERDGVKECIKLLKEKGYKNIAFVGNLSTESTRLKYEGYKLGMLEYYPENEFVLIECLQHLEADYDANGELFERFPETDAVVYAEDLMAAKSLSYFRNCNIQVPNDIGIIGVDNSIYSEITYPTLTTLDNRMEDMGLEVAKFMVDCLSGKEKPKRIMLFPAIIERESTNRHL